MTVGSKGFQMGQLLLTAAVQEWVNVNPLANQFVAESIARHAGGDWGDVGAEDAAANEAALLHGARLFSVYVAWGTTIWIITEAGRHATTVLFPEDY